VKVWISAIGLILLVFCLGVGSGCGGGGTTGSGGNNGGNNGGNGGNISRFVIEATKNGTIIDPTNIVEGEVVQFVVAGYTATNQRIVQSSSGWTIDPTGETEGTITSGGLFTATASGGQFTVSATSGSTLRTGIAQVRPAGQALVTGRVINGYGGFVYGAVVDFFNAGGAVVGSSIVQGNGTFRASVPDTAVTFELRKTAIPLGYYKEYFYSYLKPFTTTVTNGVTSATQTLASTANIIASDALYFVSHAAYRDVVSVTAPSTVVLDASVTTTTNEQVKIFGQRWFLPQGACRAPLPALTNGTTTALESDIIVPPTSNNGSSLPPPPPPSPCG
jgi:hypothetical protein